MGVVVEKRYHFPVLCLILTLGAVLRYYDLGSESIWLDEAYSLDFSKLSILQVLTVEDDFPPLYYIILHAWMRLFGDSEAVVRFPSMIFGVLSIAAIYRVGALLFDEGKGLLAAFLLAISTFHIHYSQEARPYSLTIFLALLSMYGLIQCHKQWRPAMAVGYVISSSLLVYSHVIGLFLLAAQNVYVFTMALFMRDDRPMLLKHWLMMQAGVGLLYLPWLPTFIIRIFDGERGTWLSVPVFRDINMTLRRYSGAFLLKLSALLALASIITLHGTRFHGGWPARLKTLVRPRPGLIQKDIRQNYLLLLWLVVPIGIPFVLSQAMTPLYCDRYTILAALGFYLLVASGIGNLRPVVIRVLVIGIFTLAGLLNLADYYRQTTREQWRDAAQHIAHYARAEDMLIFNSGDQKELSFGYYLDPARFKTIVSPPGLALVNQQLLAQWAEQALRHERVWLILTYDISETNHIVQALSKTHNQVYAIDYLGIRIHFFHRPSNDPLAISTGG